MQHFNTTGPSQHSWSMGHVGNCVPNRNVVTTQGRDRCDVISSDLTQSKTQHKSEGVRLIDEK